MLKNSFLAPPNAKMRLHWWSYSQKFWLPYYNAQLKIFCVHTTLIILLISLLYFLFLFFHFISVHPSLIFSTLSFSSSFLFSKLSFFSKFSLKFFSFSSLIFFVSSQFFLCYVRASSFAVWVWLWWVIGITAMSWV